MRLDALVTERLPGNVPLTRDLLTMLEHGDNVVVERRRGATFGLPLVPLDEQLRRAVWPEKGTRAAQGGPRFRLPALKW